MQHIEDVKTISGPVSAHVFELPGKGSVYLFGDVHFSYDNRCSGCSESKGCYKIVDFIERAMKRTVEAGGAMDVYLELPYVPAAKGLRERAVSWIDAYFSRNASVGVALEGSLGKLIGRSPQYIGMFSKLYRRFGGRTYHHNKVDGYSDRNNVRFHYADARLEPNAMSLIVPMQKSVEWLVDFHTRVNSAAKLAALLNAFLFSKDFPRDVRGLIGQDARIVDVALSTMELDGKPCKVHKIAKQFYKLSGPVRAAVARYLKDRVDRIQGFMAEGGGFDAGAKLLDGSFLAKVQRSKAPSHEMAMFRDVLHQRAMNYLNESDFTIMFVGCTVLMDAYLICRMMHYLTRGPASTKGNASKQPASQCAIVYAGDAHIEHYADFLMNYMGARAVLCAPMDESNDSDIVRCVDTGSLKCPMSSVRSMFPAASAGQGLGPSQSPSQSPSHAQASVSQRPKKKTTKLTKGQRRST